MGRKGHERVSQREYARRLGLSNEAVRKAVEDGRISSGWDKKEKKIIVEKANAEWGNIHLKIIEEGDQAQAEALRRIQSLGTQANKSPEDTEAETLQEIMEFELAVSSKASFAEALRVEKVAKARQEIIKLREATGELVNKEEVYKKLFAFGQSVRNAMLAVPDRCIDSLIVASNRATAHQILVKEIHDALEKLTTPPEIKPDDENKN